MPNLKNLTDRLTDRIHLNGSGQLSMGASYTDVLIHGLIQYFSEMKNVCLVSGFLPLAWLLIDIGFDNLGSNPIQALHIRLGDWSLRFLCITLTITPIQKITRQQGMAAYRQLFGLFCFFYATLHLLAYLWLDHALEWRIIIIDIVESSYLWFGVIAYVIILSLALTSSKAAQKAMGKNWKKLHRFIYTASVAVIIHYFWQLKGNLLEPIFYTIIVGLLLLFRVTVWLQNKYLSKLMVPKSRKQDD